MGYSPAILNGAAKGAKYEFPLNVKIHFTCIIDSYLLVLTIARKGNKYDSINALGRPRHGKWQNIEQRIMGAIREIRLSLARINSGFHGKAPTAHWRSAI